ncbi:MAG: FeoB-associated Cys-rich membrane protein [Isosphaeraceae bacterium]
MTPATAFGWQDLAALALVLGAVVFLGRGYWRRSARGVPGCGPGGSGCQGCPSNPGRSEGPGCSEPVTIGIGVEIGSNHPISTAAGPRTQVISPRR